MDASKISERTRTQLDALPPEKRAKAEAAIARTQSREYRAREAGDREALDREYRQTGRIATVGGESAGPDRAEIEAFLSTLRAERESAGLSLADVAERSGIDKAALSRLESGQQANPTLQTLSRYARAIGKRLRWALQEEPTPRG